MDIALSEPNGAPPTTPAYRLRSMDTGVTTKKYKVACKKPAAITNPSSLAGIVGSNIMSFYEVSHLKKLIKCYKTGEFPFFTFSAKYKGTCASCWDTIPRLGLVARHSKAPGLVVHAACQDGPLPCCNDCGEEAAANLSFRKIRNQEKLRCSRCSHLNHLSSARYRNGLRRGYEVPAIEIGDVESDDDF